MGEMPVWLSTTLLGLGTVFVGLICLIYITKLMSLICTRLQPKPAPAADKAAAQTEEIPDRGAFCAAVAACIATTMGTQAEGLRIVSIKRAE